jgi:hypothetical protein
MQFIDNWKMSSTSQSAFIFHSFLEYLLTLLPQTPWDMLEKLLISQLVKKGLTFYRTQRPITVFIVSTVSRRCMSSNDSTSNIEESNGEGNSFVPMDLC